MGLVPPGTIEKSTLKVSHAVSFDEKSGGDVFCCATVPVEIAAQAKPAKTPRATNFAVEANVDIAFLLRMVCSTQETGCRGRALFSLSRLIALRAPFILRRFGTFVTRCEGHERLGQARRRPRSWLRNARRPLSRQLARETRLPGGTIGQCDLLSFAPR